MIPWDSATIHVNAVGHASVSAVFEGLKAYRDDNDRLLVFRLYEHLQRLFDSLKICRLKIDFTAEEIVHGIKSLLSANQFTGDTYIRPWAYPKGIFREHITPAWIETELVIDSWPFVSGLSDLRSCSACVSSWHRVGGNALPTRVKAFPNYHNSRLATMEARTNGYDWPILLNASNHVTEGPGACLAIIRRNTLITPYLASGVLEGITRDTVLKLAHDVMGLAVQERPVDRSELYVADEVFFMGTGWEILPVSTIDGIPIGSGGIGSVTSRFADLYDDAIRGRLPQSKGWCSPIGTRDEQL